MKNFLSQGTIYLFGEGISKGAIFIITPIIIKYHGAEDYGEIALYLSYLPLTTFLFDFGQRSSIKRFYIDNKALVNLLLVQIQIVSIIILLVCFLVCYFCNINNDLVYYLIINAFLFSSIELYLSKYQIASMALKYNLIYILRNAAPFYIYIGLLLFFEIKIELFYLSQMTIFILTLGYIQEKFKIHFFFKGLIRNIRDSLKFSLPILPAIISGVILNVSDRYIIEFYYGLEEVGFYSLAYSVGGIFLVGITALNKSWQPFILNQLKKNNIYKIKNHFRKYLLLSIASIILIIFLKKHIILLLSNENFLIVSDLINIILFGLFFYFLYTVHSNIAFFHKENIYFMIPAIIAGLINIILNFMFIKKYGYGAAAYTTLISYFVEFVIIFFIVRKRYNINIIY